MNQRSVVVAIAVVRSTLEVECLRRAGTERRNGPWGRSSGVKDEFTNHISRGNHDEDPFKRIDRGVLNIASILGHLLLSSINLVFSALRGSRHRAVDATRVLRI
jgi:hypothetical protein